MHNNIKCKQNKHRNKKIVRLDFFKKEDWTYVPEIYFKIKNMSKLKIKKDERYIMLILIKRRVERAY